MRDTDDIKALRRYVWALHEARQRLSKDLPGDISNGCLARLSTEIKLVDEEIRQLRIKCGQFWRLVR